MKPFIQWMGGKSRLSKHIVSLIPEDIKDYYEPFVGSGAVFFQLNNPNSFISDVNSELIHTYNSIKYNCDIVLELFEGCRSQHSKEFFLKIRNIHDFTAQLDIALRFIYLNKSCFNGLYRVNKKNQFNSSWGNLKQTKPLDADNIKLCSKLLQTTKIKCQSYDKINPSEGDLVYLDPPYHGLYDRYSIDKFDEQEHLALKFFCDYLTKKNVKFILSNSDTDFIKDLYKDYNISEVQLTKSFNPLAVKKTTEFIIKNF